MTVTAGEREGSPSQEPFPLGPYKMGTRACPHCDCTLSSLSDPDARICPCRCHDTMRHVNNHYYMRNNALPDGEAEKW